MYVCCAAVDGDCIHGLLLLVKMIKFYDLQYDNEDDYDVVTVLRAVRVLLVDALV